MTDAARRDRLLIVAVLLGAPLLNRWLNGSLDQSWHALQSTPNALAPGHWLFRLSQNLVVLVVLSLVSWQVMRRWQPGTRARQVLLLSGLITTLQALLNGALVVIAINTLQLGSQHLLLIGMGLYAVMNGVLLFWYWFLDHPLFGTGLPREQERRRGLIRFPDPGPAKGLTDYLYFTVLSSNCLGPPEEHSVRGGWIKLLMLMQSCLMLILLVIVVARAINTLR